MITREIRVWMEKVERGQYSYDDAMEELMRFSRFLTMQEIKQIQQKLKASYN